MVCRRDYVEIFWDDKQLYGVVPEPDATQTVLISALNQLPTEYRQIIILFAFEYFPKHTIALIKARPIEAIESTIFLGGLLLQSKRSDEKPASKPHLDKLFKGWPYSEYEVLATISKSIIFRPKPVLISF